jgi:hypothetical protein
MVAIGQSPIDPTSATCHMDKWCFGGLAGSWCEQLPNQLCAAPLVATQAAQSLTI